MRRLAWLFVLLPLLALSCESAAPTGDSAARGIEQIADEFFESYMLRYPETPTQYGLAGYRHDRLTDHSAAATAAWEAREDVWLAELEAIGEPDDVGSRDWVTYGILHEALAASVARRICCSHLWSASSTTSWHVSLPFVFDYQPVASHDEREQALARLVALKPYIETQIENLRQGLGLGYSAPRVTVERVPSEVRSLLEDNNPFLNMASRTDDEGFAVDIKATFDDTVAPAIESFAEFIEEEYLTKAREEISLRHNPDGAACYPALVRAFATVSPPADEIHSLGLQQVAAIQEEFREVIDQHYGGESTAEFLRRINTDRRFTFESEEAVLQYSVDALGAARDAMARVFGRLPRSDVIIKPYPDFAASGVGEYQPPAEDLSRPGTFYIAVIDPETRTRATQKSTLYHETYPGHHLQIAIALELGDRVHPIARILYNSGFAEGWALYSERLAQELDLYDDPIDLIGLLSDQGARAARLVVDSGLHTKDWTRQEAVDYMLDNTGWSETDIQSDVNRYISWPGQANSYMLGMLEIRRLRTLAEEQLGENFDVREFHDRLLRSGAVTLPMLESKILSWIDSGGD
jgi:uncharacterized protein (DUF885 family)